ncbi:uncharacterized protein BX663DRAFT_525820 [Cokeromyces recurvatus]|uniref:uncharacterized protein n=1 Tax=Cokeromyces recurvatus TaxID=90255 RepID=UPI00221F9680|nr:uncharacterized protein BX663DRAFT_525820 [Cokeromyces recurvatus]KAI7898131.1 hypothetical protein BX663DRAFT_525820 [Cokeromyces recurvatus]
MDKRSSEDIDMELCNKRRYFFAFIFQQMLESFCCCCKAIRYSYPSSTEMGQTLLRGPNRQIL